MPQHRERVCVCVCAEMQSIEINLVGEQISIVVFYKVASGGW